MPDQRPYKSFLFQALLLAVGGAAALGLASLLDHWTFNRLVAPYIDSQEHQNVRVYASEWGRLFRLAGDLRTWLFVGAALLLIDAGALRGRGIGRIAARAMLLLGSAALAGGLAEVVKIVARRERPNLHGGAYFYRPWSGASLPWWSTSNLGMPSSHSAVAFGAAAMLMYLYPRAAPMWLVLAAGCAATRVLSGAHFLSDAAVGAWLGVVAAVILWRVLGLRSRSAAGRLAQTG
jgi:membrane-associated phospholipid phosphatase